MNKHIKLGLLLLVMIFASNLQAAEQYLKPEQFLAEAFADSTPKQQVFWVTRDIAKQAEKILGHAPNQLRQRYWKVDGKTAWIFDEIGKEEPITAGFVVSEGKIVLARVLTYRESRGGEVRYTAFLKQYLGAELQEDQHLNRNIDGISGATLSVNAMNRMVRLALYFDRMSRIEKVD
ncbi:MAG: FMN-binding protein [Betaproteobacteria bacterium HGW-Betaproteobacteria-22]|nr:MAG: FMN-binding protein [Betaproteobacteria bacterium HGW-Betaproteobacteria-22]